ncbi:MAG: hypothetical protein JOS17DRAFT_804750 [Linnemannia elongata]|nr:MAG: hypothetical protein JOS17DRAFT_804750 [Linnemannia elongata]
MAMVLTPVPYLCSFFLLCQPAPSPFEGRGSAAHNTVSSGLLVLELVLSPTFKNLKVFALQTRKTDIYIYIKLVAAAVTFEKKK